MIQLKLKILLFVITVALSFCQAQTPFDTLITLHSYEVYFDIGKANLRPEADTMLQQLLAQLADKSRFSLRITAHTDAVGSTDANLKLSEARAEAVRQALIAKGVLDSVFTVSVFGESQPISNNTTEKGRQLNRRATIAVLKSVRMIRIGGKVIDPITGKGIESEVIVHTKELRDTMQTDSSGGFQATVPLGEVFGVDVFAAGYFFEMQMSKAVIGEMPRLTIHLKRIEVGASIDLKNFYFVGNQDTLLKSSEPELPKLLKSMKLNPLITIEIAGHIHRLGLAVTEDSWDYNLSVRRAKKVYDYLISNGIEPIRVLYKGYGNWQLRFPDAKNEKEASQNRRVEIKVVAIGN